MITATDKDIEDAMSFASESSSPSSSPPPLPEWDEMMVEDVAMYEEMALDARLADMAAGQVPDQPLQEDDDFNQALLGLIGEAEPQPYHHDGDDQMDMS